MKIGIYDPYLDDLGGGEKYMMTIAECLSKEHTVKVFWDKKSDFEALTQRFSLDLSKVSLTKNIFHQSTSFFTRLQVSSKYDAIILLSDGSIPFLWTKLYVHIQQPLRQFEKGSFKNNLKLSRVTKFFSNSEYTKSFIHKKFDLKTLVIYPPVETKAKDLPKENIILHVGRFRPQDRATGASDYKKQQVMIDAFKEMVDRGLKNWKFIVATTIRDTDNEEFEQMKKRTHGYPIEFLVNKTNDELWEIYSKAKIYWHASGFGEDLKAHPEFAEHFGISTVEAMSAGCVPVVINAGGQKEIVTHKKNGLLWDTLEELKKETLSLTKDSTLFDTLSKEARTVSKQYSKETFCQKTALLLQ